MAGVRMVAVVTLIVLSLLGTTDVAAAPNSISGSVPTAALARAVRLAAPAAPAPPPAPAPPGPTMSPFESEMLARVNAERAARGLAPMQYDARLALAAQRHSEDQAARNTMSHTGVDGSSVATRVDRIGYDWRSLAENVAYGYTDVTSVMNGWMASDGHRRNILSGNVHVGFGLAIGRAGRPYWTQVFAAPA